MSKILIVSEIGINHNGNMKTAKELILKANECEVDVVKFQLYDVDKFFKSDWEWYEKVKRTQLSREQWFDLVNYCKDIGIEFLASAHDLERLAWCEEVGMKRHKVATSCNKNKELIDAMCETGKDVLISCQFRANVYYPKLELREHIKYLYCIPLYPTSYHELGLNTITFPWEFRGFSDHTLGVEASVAAMARGATIIEKHFTLDKNDRSGPDHVCSIEPEELKELVHYARKFEEILQ